MDSYANWFEFFSDFSTQYREIKRKIGIEDINSSKKGGKIPPPPPPPSLSTEQQTCLNLLSNMHHRKKFSATGRMNKSTIEKFVADNSLGIVDLDRYFEIMGRANILENGRAQVTFSEKIIKATSLDEIKQEITNCFRQSS